MWGVISVNTGHIASDLGIRKDCKYFTVGSDIKNVEARRRYKEMQCFAWHCIQAIKEELRKYVHFRQDNHRMDDIFIAIERTFNHYEMKEFRIIEPSEKELKSLDLEDKVPDIIYGKYEVMPSWCPQFAKMCERILEF